MYTADQRMGSDGKIAEPGGVEVLADPGDHHSVADPGINRSAVFRVDGLFKAHLSPTPRSEEHTSELQSR